MVKYKDKILLLREDGKSYNEIVKELGCSKATVSYHCKKWSLNDIGLGSPNKASEKKYEINEYYKTHTTDETANFFDISRTSVIRYTENKREEITIEEKRKRNYIRVKTKRQLLKEKSVKYKGGKCIKCGYKKSIWSLNFHHRDPKEKDFGIGSYSILSWEKIKIELDKCDLLCANCHGEEHEKIENDKHEKIKQIQKFPKGSRG